jgi:hypothetical protein
MPKKLRPAVDLMAFKCRTLKVKSNVSSVQKGMGKGTFLVSLHQALYLKTYESSIVASDIDFP